MDTNGYLHQLQLASNDCDEKKSKFQIPFSHKWVDNMHGLIVNI